MDRHSKNWFRHAFLCLLVLSRAQALDVRHDFQLSGPSRYDNGRGRLRFSPATRDCKPSGNPRALLEELELGGAYDQGADASSGRRRARLNSNSGSNFEVNMLPHESSDSTFHPPKSRSRRVALQLTPSRRAAVEALTTFKAGITGGNLSVFESWDANDTTPCGWIGVTCSTSSEQVIGLSLVGHQLKGSINSALLALGPIQSLQRLDLSNNTFGSSLTGASLLNFSNIAFVNLSFNFMEGEIPHELGELTNLQSLTFQFNNLSGSIPPSLCNCTLLRELNLQQNLLTGEIPPDIGRLVSLELLDLSSWVDRVDTVSIRVGNLLNGGIPPSLGNCSSLSILNLDLNDRLGGQLPDELSQLYNLEVFSVTACVLEGVIPGWIGNLTNLGEIHFTSNNFRGPIPAEIGKLQSLSWLALGVGDLFGEGASLSGNVPESIGNCTSLAWLRISITSITGIIPPSLANCTRLIEFTIHENPLMVPARIPSWLSSLEQLEFLSLAMTNRIGLIPNELWTLQLLGLWLGHNSLVGPISALLTNCTFLEVLQLDSNSLNGNLPFELGALSNLGDLRVSNNTLTGLVPSSIANLTRLSNLLLSENSFHGTIDSSFGNLPKLQVFLLGGNHFVGSIPMTLSNCSNLEYIHIDHNHLSGDIPDSFGNLSQLIGLTLSGNEISGTIPVELARCSDLANLDLSSNRLRGDFPYALGRITFLSYLNFSHNQLTGTIASTTANSMTNFSQLLWLDISYNQFSGGIPWERINLKFMVSINVSHNFFTGSMSADWSNAIDIVEIDLSANNVSGSIPTMQGLLSLERLDLSFNNFSGNIPESLASISHLVFLNVSYNKLEGPIPDFGASGSNITAASFVENPGLCGDILGPLWECQHNISISRGRCKLFHCTKTWIPILVAGIASIIFILAMVAFFINRSRRKKEDFDILVNFRNPMHFMTISPIDILTIIEDEANVVGATANSFIYKGLLPGYANMIAIKTFVGHNEDKVGLRAADLFRSMLEREATLQASLRHRNILKVLSFCSHSKFEALLLEYMPQGSLHDHLYPCAIHAQGHPPEGLDPRELEGPTASLVLHCELPWSLRLSIVIDIAEGMTYMHHGCPEPLIHGDLKPSNILLDEDMVAKVSDFGISRLVNLRGKNGEFENGEATASKFWGTAGYMPPEYAYLTTVSTKGDVFSYGILLLEMLSGVPPIEYDSREADYRAWNLRIFQDNILELLDPTLQCEARTKTLKEKQMMLVVKVALFATRLNPQSRPSMKDISSMLLQIKGLEVEMLPQQRTMIELAEDDGEVVDKWESTNPNSADLFYW